MTPHAGFAVAMVVRWAVFCKGAGLVHPSPSGRATSIWNGATHSSSVQVRMFGLPSGSSAGVAWYPTKDTLSRMPHDARATDENGTGTLCVSSMTESTAPFAPQYQLKSAARYTVELETSMSRCGTLWDVPYPITGLITSTPGIEPPKFGVFRFAGWQPPPPVAGCGQCPVVGFGVFSFVTPAPPHQRLPV